MEDTNIGAINNSVEKTDYEIPAQKIYNKFPPHNICPICSKTLKNGCKFCPECGYNLNTDKHTPPSKIKNLIIILAVMIILLLGVITVLIANNLTHKYSNLTLLEKTLETPKTTINANMTDKALLVDEQLNIVKKLCNDKNYKNALKELYSINKEDLDEHQRLVYIALETDIDKNLSPNGNMPIVQPHEDINNDTNDDNYEFSIAYINGAKTGDVYFWIASSGDEYNAIIPNGTLIYTTGYSVGNRTLVMYGNAYGWITSKYINTDNTSSYAQFPIYHIEGASTGSVYVWNSSNGDSYITTIPNGTIIHPTGRYKNNRTEIYWDNGYAWITSDYIR